MAPPSRLRSPDTTTGSLCCAASLPACTQLCTLRKVSTASALPGGPSTGATSAGQVSAAIAAQAKSQGVKVIDYDRLTLDTDAQDYYVSFDNEKVGELQAAALVEAHVERALLQAQREAAVLRRSGVRDVEVAEHLDARSNCGCRMLRQFHRLYS